MITPDAAFFVNQGKPEGMHATGRREAERKAVREPLLALWAALAGKPIVSGTGKATVGSIAVDQFAFWIDGCETTFGVGDDGRIRTATFRGRGPQLWFGEVVLTFDDFQAIGGVILPATVRGNFDGKPAPALDEIRAHVEVDAELAKDTFERAR